MFENPGQQRSGRGLAVRAGDNDGALAANKVFLEQLGQRAEAQLPFEHDFGLGVAARDGVADNDKVGLVIEIGLGVAVHHRDLFRGEKGGHGRINVLIRASDGKAPVLHRAGDTGHGCATDADEMDTLHFGKHGASVFGRATERRKTKLAGKDSYTRVHVPKPTPIMNLQSSGAVQGGYPAPSRGSLSDA